MTTPTKIKYLPSTAENTEIHPQRNQYYWVQLECQHCRQMFNSKRIHRRYCSGRCRVAAHRQATLEKISAHAREGY